MRIVIDMQGIQRVNPHFDFDFIQFIKIILKNSAKDEIHFALNGFFSDSIDVIRDEFYKIIPDENIHVFFPPGNLSANFNPKKKRKTLQIIRESFLSSLKPDIILIFDVFGSADNDSFYSIRLFNNKTPVCVFCKPGLKKFLSDIDIDNDDFYFRRIDNLRRADLIFVFSEADKQELTEKTGLSKDSVVCISKSREGDIFFGDNSEINHNEERFYNISKILFSELENLYKKTIPKQPLSDFVRPKLAFVSPLPPDESGISYYSSELIPELSRFYDIDVVISNESVSNSQIRSLCEIKSIEWFLHNSRKYDRVLYQIGNSILHQHMFNLLDEIPGVVALHDFFLSHIVARKIIHESERKIKAKELYNSHGYKAVYEHYHNKDDAEFLWKYPCNLSVIQSSVGVIVHSNYAKELADEWYGENFADGWALIPHLRIPVYNIDRKTARESLNLSENDFIVCSFGRIGLAKLNDRLIEAWNLSGLSKEKNCRLIFVGENPENDYGGLIKEKIIGKNIEITGWVDDITYKNYLAGADFAVQLRTLSRGETSGAVLDCLNYGLATIINANGALADFTDDVVCKLPDEFNIEELVNSLELLFKDFTLRERLGKNGQELIRKKHNPRICAGHYFEAIEKFYKDFSYHPYSLIKKFDKEELIPSDLHDLEILSESTDKSMPEKFTQKKLLIDVSAISEGDIQTGVQRVVKGILNSLLENPPKGYRIEPVYLSNKKGRWHYYYATKYTLQLLESPAKTFNDEIVSPGNRDILFVIDLCISKLTMADEAGLLLYYKNIGVKIYNFVHDLLPVQFPEFFPPGSDVLHTRWLEIITKFHGAICNSQYVAKELRSWILNRNISRNMPFYIGWAHLGADIDKSFPSKNSSNDFEDITGKLKKKLTFLMVGAVDPRKAYLQTILAFTRLWSESFDINLVIVGKEGWKDLPENKRRNIPEIVNAILNHSELNRHVFWFQNASDELLEKIYAVSTCLLYPSEGEGFGLPLIEAAIKKLPVIARDIPIFREVAGDNVFFFPDDNSPDILYDKIKEWLELYKKDIHPKSDKISYNTWDDCVQKIKMLLFENKWDYIYENKEK